jgi:hypothetical protein
MKEIDKIIELTKRLASLILNKSRIHHSDLNDLFDEKDSNEIISKLSNPASRKRREVLTKIINKSKKSEWKELEAKINPPKNNFDFNQFLKVAAVFICFIGIGGYFYSEKEEVVLIEQEQVLVKNDEITLLLDNGNVEIIAESGEKKILDREGKIVGSQSGKELNYKENEKEIVRVDEVLAYNELTIPYGKTFKIVLSDGTSVHLNAGSTLKYPVKFIKGEERKVFLTGEAYFDVAKDKAHPFIVNANDLNVRVLGTEFNMSSYPEDNRISTVLVEGSVSLYTIHETYNKDMSAVLKPGYKATWNQKKKNIHFNKVNTDLYTSWKDGRIIFEHVKFKNIIRKLERRYDVSIENTNLKLAHQVFTASFDIETIDQVLKTFSKNFPISYEIRNRNIIIY